MGFAPFPEHFRKDSRADSNDRFAAKLAAAGNVWSWPTARDGRSLETRHLPQGGRLGREQSTPWAPQRRLKAGLQGDRNRHGGSPRQLKDAKMKMQDTTNSGWRGNAHELKLPRHRLQRNIAGLLKPPANRDLMKTNALPAVDTGLASSGRCGAANPSRSGPAPWP